MSDDDGKTKGAGGRPPHEPTVQQRHFVETCAMGGITQDDICEVIGISKKTLHKHYRDELDTAYSKANAKVVQTAFQLATSGKCPSMTMFWLKTRMGWREKQEIDVTTGGESLNRPSAKEVAQQLASMSTEEKSRAFKELVGDLDDDTG